MHGYGRHMTNWQFKFRHWRLHGQFSLPSSLPPFLPPFHPYITTGRSSSYSSAYKTAIKCITYLSDGGHPAKDRVFVSGGENTAKVDRWLESIDRGEVS